MCGTARLVNLKMPSRRPRELVQGHDSLKAATRPLWVAVELEFEAVDDCLSS